MMPSRQGRGGSHTVWKLGNCEVRRGGRRSAGGSETLGVQRSGHGAPVGAAEEVICTAGSVWFKCSPLRDIINYFLIP